MQASADPRGERGRISEGEEPVLRADVATDRQYVRTDGRQRLATSHPGRRKRTAEHAHQQRLGQIRKLRCTFSSLTLNSQGTKPKNIEQPEVRAEAEVEVDFQCSVFS